MLAPWEFLVLTQGFSKDKAVAIVEEFRLSGTRPEGDFEHIDLEVPHFRVLPQTQLRWVWRCQEDLREHLDIVQEYIRTRNLTFETLKRHGIGYNAEDDSLIFPYFFSGLLTGVRIRTFDGRKLSVKNSHFLLYNLDAIDSAVGKTVIICEGETDTLFLSQELAARNIRVPVLGAPGAKVDPLKWERHLKPFSRILFIPHSDRESFQLAGALQSTFKDRFEVVRLPWGPKQHGKDVVDFCRTQSPEIVIQELGLTEVDIEVHPRVRELNDAYKAAETKPAWVIPGLLERGQKLLITGQPKTRKTFIALDLARAVAMCEPFMGFQTWTPTEPATVLLVEGEGTFRELGVRLKKIFEGRQSDRVKILHRERVKLDDPESLAQLRRDCLKLQPSLLILDPFRNFHDQDENSSQEMSLVFAAIDSLIRTLPTMAIVTVHHSPKGSPGSRGSGVIWASVDSQVYVEKREHGITTLKIEGRPFPDQQSSFQFVFDAGTFRHVPIESASGIKINLLGVDRSRARSFFEDNPGTAFTIEEIKDALGLTYEKTRRVLRQLVEAGDIARTGSGNKGDPYRYQRGGREEGE